MCEKHHFGIKRSSDITKIPDGNQKPLQKTWNTFKNAAEIIKPKKVSSFSFQSDSNLATINVFLPFEFLLVISAKYTCLVEYALTVVSGCVDDQFSVSALYI